MAIEIIRLNLIPDGKVPVVHCKQYDVDRAFKVCVYEGDKPYIFSDETVELNVRKSDTTLVTTDLDVTSGVHCLIVHTTEQMCAVTGKNECEIRVIKEGANIGSLNFIMEIKKSPTEGGLRSDSEINNLRRQMEDIIDPVLDEMVPPIVEELVPQVIGDDYYNKTEINTIVEGIDTALESIGHGIDGINDDIDNLETALGSKADTTYVNTELAKKADKTDTYTKTQVDSALNNKMNKANPTGTGSFSLNRKANTTIGNYSFAEGYNCEASGQGSHAEGLMTKSTGHQASHAEGVTTTASGTMSHAEGVGSTASGEVSHAEGYDAIASGMYSHAEGYNTEAGGECQHVFGKYNIIDRNNEFVEIVGNGPVGIWNERSNARTLDWQGNETLAGDVIINGNQSVSGEISRLDGKIDNLPSPMVFKGTLGVGGTIQTLPAASASNEGYTYKVITDGTYAGQTAKVGDVFTSNGSDWVLIPSGDEDNDTWRAIKVEGVEVLGNGISSGAVDFVGSENIEVDFDGNGNKVGVKTKNIYTKKEVDDIVYNILPDDTASGSVANFETDLALPLKSLKADVNAVQDLHGYSKPWIGGAGKNKVDWRGPQTITTQKTLVIYATSKQTQYTVSIYAKNISSINARLGVVLYNDSTIVGQQVVYISPETDGRVSVTIDTSSYTYNQLRVVISSQSAGYEVTVSDLQVEEGTVATDWTPYENICPITGWNAVNVTHTSGEMSAPVSLDFGQTVFGGTIDLTTGLLRITKAFIDLSTLTFVKSGYSWRYQCGTVNNMKITTATSKDLQCSAYYPSTHSWSTYNGASICINQRVFVISDDRFQNNASGLMAWLREMTNAGTPVIAVYPLATPIEIQLTAQEIEAFVGTNNIWADTGDCAVEFKVSVEQYVEEAIASVQALVLNT